MSEHGDVTVRPVRNEDHAEIQRLLKVAFGGPDEAVLVDLLRGNGDMLLELAALRDARIAGCIAFSRAWIETAAERVPVACLAPVAVDPACQSRGIGAELVRRGLAMLEKMHETVVFVLGEPGYYSRFGFVSKAAQSFPSQFSEAASDAHMIRQSADRQPIPPGRLVYSAAFDAVSG